MSAVYRWRPVFQADFAARLDWCVLPYTKANHPPVIRSKPQLKRIIRSGDRVTLDASGSHDPDGDTLSYEWSFYKEPGTYAGPLLIESDTSKLASFIAPSVTSAQTLHILLTVRDSGHPTLSNYQRIIVTVAPKR